MPQASLLSKSGTNQLHNAPSFPRYFLKFAMVGADRCIQFSEPQLEMRLLPPEPMRTFHFANLKRQIMYQ